MKWQARVKIDSYELLRFEIRFPLDYPKHPPIIRFSSRVKHPKIDRNGKIDISILKDKWSPELTISNVLHSII